MYIRIDGEREEGGGMLWGQYFFYIFEEGPLLYLFFLIVLSKALLLRLSAYVFLLCVGPHDNKKPHKRKMHLLYE